MKHRDVGVGWTRHVSGRGRGWLEFWKFCVEANGRRAHRPASRGAGRAANEHVKVEDAVVIRIRKLSDFVVQVLSDVVDGEHDGAREY